MLDDAPSQRLTVGDLARRDDVVLGAARISPSMRLIRGPGGEASLEPRTMQVLVALLDARGRVVTRDALFRRCWGDAVVGDDSLNRAIADIRRVARTVAVGSFAIETAPRTGYRLTETASATEPPTEEAAPGRAAWARRGFLFAAPAAIAAGGIGWWALTPPYADHQVSSLIDRSDAAMRLATPESWASAAELLERAVAVEPRDATAWGRLALAQGALVEVTPPGQAPAAVASVQEAARRALALDPRQADALSALATLPPYFGDWLAAERRMREVLKIAPGHLRTLDALAFLLVGVGRARESAAWRLKFSAREPLHVEHQYRLIYAHWILDRVEEADRTTDRALQLWPKHIAVWFARLWLLAFTGRANRALAHLEDSTARPDLPPWMVETLRVSVTAIGSGRAGDRAAAVDRLLGEVSRSPSNAINALLLLNGMGEIDRAFEVANAYLLEDGPLMASVRWRPGQVAVNDQRRRKTHSLFVPVAAGMRADPRFAELTRRIGLSDYWAKAGVRADV